jgi:histidinol-phosphate aminotransferase
MEVQMNRYIPERINKIDEYTPSDGVYSIRLDANENPYPMPPEIVKEFCAGLEKCDFNRYPDPIAAALTKIFAEVNRTEPEYVVAGNGSDELINLLLNLFLIRGDLMAVTKPDFSMYSFYAGLIGCDIITAGKSDGGEINFNELRTLVSANNCKTVIFSNPCNPTGRAYDRETILSFVRAVDCVVIVDEAYMEFCREGCSVIDMCGKQDNLIVLKTLSKAYGSAGLRVGFSVSSSDIAAAIRKLKSPYNLNAVSQIFGQIVLNHHNDVAVLARKIADDTQILRTRLLEISDTSGFTPLETDANFVLLAFDYETRAEIIYRRLKEKDIIIRCPDRRHLRITCGSEYENERLLTELINIKLQVNK